jgi:hypothetical protein
MVRLGDVQSTYALVSPFTEGFRKVWDRLGHPLVSGIDNPEKFFPVFGLGYRPSEPSQGCPWPYQTLALPNPNPTKP